MKNYELVDKLVAINRVTKVTKGGRSFSFSALVVVGDDKAGVIGYGLGKADDVSMAIAKGVETAKKNLIEVSILKHTISHAKMGKFGASKVLLRPAAPGTGLIAGGAMRAVLECVGVKDILAKSLGSANPHNVVKATIDALKKVRTPAMVAKERGLKLDQLFQ